MKNKGFEKYGIRPVGNQVALLLSADDLKMLGSPYAPKEEESDILQPKTKPSIISNSKGQPIFKGKTVEEEEKEEAKKDRTWTVASVSNIMESNNSNEIEVGDEVSLKDCQIVEVKVGENIFGIVPTHAIILVHKEKINPGV